MKISLLYVLSLNLLLATGVFGYFVFQSFWWFLFLIISWVEAYFSGMWLYYAKEDAMFKYYFIKFLRYQGCIIIPFFFILEAYALRSDTLLFLFSTVLIGISLSVNMGALYLEIRDTPGKTVKDLNFD